MPDLSVALDLHTGLKWLNFIGVVACAMSGSLLAVRKRFDLFGVLLLGCVTAVGGGAIRDTLTGQIPPLFLRDETYLWLALLGAGLAFSFGVRLEKIERTIRVFDSLTLASFAASGAVGAIQLNLGPLGVIFAGTLSGVGGGVVRDLIANEIPEILYRNDQLYATAAAGGALTVLLLYPHLTPFQTQMAGFSVVLLLRLISRMGWLKLPIRRLPQDRGGGAEP